MPETKARVLGRKRKNAFAHRPQIDTPVRGKRRILLAHPNRKRLFVSQKRRIWVPVKDKPECLPEAGRVGAPVPVECVCRDKDECVYIAEPVEPVGLPREVGCLCAPDDETAPHRGIRPIDADFLRHMSQYIGMTVTVYTASGGESGCGVTGILIVCADSYVRLLTQPASAPERPQGLCRTCPFYAVCSARKTQRPQGACLGAMVDIPVEHITIFVHSAVYGDMGNYNT